VRLQAVILFSVVNSSVFLGRRYLI